MLFKKQVAEDLKITDTKDSCNIHNTYFKFKESNYPFDSLQFKQYLETGKVIVIDTNGFKNGQDWEKYMVKDEHIEKVKEEDKKVFEKKQKEDKKVADKEAKRLEKIADKKFKEKKKAEEKALKNVIVIQDSEVEESVSKHLLG